ncbi:TIGR03747 family integrating conjugative element membrane protein [Citrobacter amalonaticus]|uniref:TIGR03747 family integrating conjugative element membrane protein n=1 Tax=Citrobacter amalonaticus TaxID=35703 RepID=UPI00300C263C
MSDHASPPPFPGHKGPVTILLALAGQVIATLLAALFIRLLAEWTGIAFFWPEQGAEHAHLMMNRELAWFSGNIVRSVVMADPAGHLNQALLQVWQWLFVDTGAVAWGEQQHYRFLADSANWRHGLNTYLQATVWTVLTFTLRLFLLLLTAPLFVLTTLVGLVDGLVRRDIRRFGCGYESGFIYHHARRAIRPVFLLPWMIYLALPFSINPDVILLPAAGLLGFVVSIAVGAFKKYL